MNKLNHYSQSGHCYPELVEKVDGKIIAQFKANLWRDNYNNINTNFLKTLKEPLKDGIKILFFAKIGFDPVHGLSLTILDIDPSFTLGDLEKEKQECIEKLKKENLFTLNKTTRLALLPQRIAIISVESSKGYADFIKVLEENAWNYKFFHYLFPSLLQGEKAITGIITQLKQIKKVAHHFDVVAIIRGGGGDVGLSCYNNYDLSKEIASFPIPVITGIGHATNETVSEMVSYQNAITPTKIAEFLIQKFHNFSVPVDKATEIITDKARRLLSEEKVKVQSIAKLFRSMTETIILKNSSDINNLKVMLMQQVQVLLKSNLGYVSNYSDSISKSSTYKVNENKLLLKQLLDNLKNNLGQSLKEKKLQLNHLEKNLEILDPINILKRGFSITYHNGKSVKDIAKVAIGETIETKVYKGKIISTVKSKNNGE